ncbi:MAG: hypothetical protein CM15mP102_06770 [Flavobacteriales bacterium]|nr:MAG: hypothetical protein CM15mP102_06770 [Flavobacteriales bacterium]
MYLAGASFGYSLIWAIVLSIFSTIVLQEMSLRIGLITNMNLAQVIRINIKSKFLNRLLLILIISSILMEMLHMKLEILQELHLVSPQF